MTGWVLAAVPVLALAAIKLRDAVEAEDLLLDLWDHARLERADLAALDAAWAANPARSPVMVSLTTIPSRMPHLGLTLKSLLRQRRAPAEIRLNVPRVSRRERVPYAVPGWLRGLRSVRIVECEDDGPATKFIPTLRAAPPDAMVLVVDDDRIYPAELVATLEAAAVRQPDAAHGACGWIVPPDLTDRPTRLSNVFRRPPAPVPGRRLRRPVEVDVLKGVAGYLVRPRFFDAGALGDYSRAPADAFFVDDVWLSGHCRVPKFVQPMPRADLHPRRLAALYRRTSLGRLDADTRRNTAVLRHFGAACWRVGGRQA